MESQLILQSDHFNLDFTLDCGQVFRWVKKENWWVGVVEGNVIKIEQENKIITIKSNSNIIDEKFIKTYFRFDDQLKNIVSEISKDNYVTEAVSRYYGLRLLRQNPWECAASFTCATYKNINSIKLMISNISRKFGKRIEFNGESYYSFPEPEIIANSDINSLTDCGLGYRAKFLSELAKRIVSKEIVLEELIDYDYHKAKSILLSKQLGKKFLIGIGPKVADCILLFSLEKMDSFPIDVWIKRVVFKFYSHLFTNDSSIKNRVIINENNSIGFSEYENISNTMRMYFGRYAGYAQEYLYHYMRVSSIS